jgi:hypothetical protein
MDSRSESVHFAQRDRLHLMQFVPMPLDDIGEFPSAVGRRQEGREGSTTYSGGALR